MDREPVKDAARPSLDELKEASRALKEKIIDEQRKNDMPVNASLGDPAVDARNADGRNDLPESEDE
jgi:hypothetical protein